MGSTVGSAVQGVVNRARQVYNQDSEGLREAYRNWRNSPSMYQVARHLVGSDRSSSQQRQAKSRKPAGKRAQSRRSAR
jgi:hypothetical protein